MNKHPRITCAAGHWFIQTWVTRAASELSISQWQPLRWWNGESSRAIEEIRRLESKNESENAFGRNLKQYPFSPGEALIFRTYGLDIINRTPGFSYIRRVE